MRVKVKFDLMVMAVMLAAFFCFAEVRALDVLWLDNDMKNIPEPKARKSDYYDYFIKGQIIEGAKRDLDIPHWVRRGIGRPKQAANVNALDEVPDSSWYTNRHYRHRMSIDELKRGPNQSSRPDFSRATVTRAKLAGVTPGLQVKDAAGNSYLIKFDSANYPNLQSGAEVITTKILYAAGYNVPENYVAYLDLKTVEIADGVEVSDPKTLKKRPMVRDDLDEMIRRVARTADGRCRVMASKILAGKPKGPFPQLGFRSDDPNDLIPHEDRRDLRAFRVIASWLNDWDLKEEQTMDMYVEEGGRKFLRHYFLDFGSSLGADSNPTEYYHGHEYGLDSRTVLKEILSLGLYESGNEKRARIISSEVGTFTTDGFDPERWKQTFPAIVFDNLTDADAFWATRVILSFTEPELRAIVETAEYSDPASINYVVRTLLERRQMVAADWLRKVDALANFKIERSGDGLSLTFNDLLVDHRLALADSTEYVYQIKGTRYESEKKRSETPVIEIDRASLAAAIERGSTAEPVELIVWTNRHDAASAPVKIFFNWSPNGDLPKIRRIARG